jgi:primosomal protein N' (replication factor Y)
MTMRFAHVLVLRDLNRYYTYAVDSGIEPGDHIEVPFGKSIALGLVMRIIPKPSTRYAIKPMIRHSPHLPRLYPDLIELIDWFSDYYYVTPYVSYTTIVGTNRTWITPPAMPDPPKTVPDLPLTTHQQDALNALQATTNEHLLFGVTGSGKTELYVHLARALLNQNKSVLVLLPEINLTPQIQRYFESRFGTGVTTLHSGMTPRQRNIAWSQIYSNQVRIIIGPRSAVFSPIQNLGLILMDEAHDQSYKQDNTPLYHAITIARKRTQYHNAKLVYGTATPDIGLYHTLSKRNQVVQLTHRIANPTIPLPTIDCVDTTLQPTTDGISDVLHQALVKNLDLKQKSIILLNRRGYAPFVTCSHCNTPHICTQCQLSYTYHADQTFRCHRCGICDPMTHTCLNCKKPGLHASGLGIQKLELALRQQLPNATIIRMDRDTANTLKKQTEQLDAFRDHGDILIGTQMIAKGHHIDAITLVGILGIETVLNSPHFRSSEHAFQLITQVAGRAGRGTQPGRVILQTTQPDHYAIEAAQQYDFLGLYETEIDTRHLLNYPPFSHLFRILTYATVAKQALAHLTQCYQVIRQALPTATLSEPCPAPLEKQNNYYRFHSLIRISDALLPDCHAVLKELPAPPKSVRRHIDREPVTLV